MLSHATDAHRTATLATVKRHRRWVAASATAASVPTTDHTQMPRTTPGSPGPSAALTALVVAMAKVTAAPAKARPDAEPVHAIASRDRTRPAAQATSSAAGVS